MEIINDQKARCRQIQDLPPESGISEKIPPLNLIGVFVLAAGLAAFVAVLYLGYVKFFYDVEYRDGLQAEQSVAIGHRGRQCSGGSGRPERAKPEHSEFAANAGQLADKIRRYYCKSSFGRCQCV